MMVTIDGEDAKDLDDAVSLYMDGDNYVLGVHIADAVSYTHLDVYKRQVVKTVEKYKEAFELLTGSKFSR